jgi:hypothetical protein
VISPGPGIHTPPSLPQFNRLRLWLWRKDS